jgi:16S rRNA (cytosine1402-N4)-methyltransferase
MDQPTPSPPQEPPRYHEPVMVDEVVDNLAPASEGWIVDGTFGGGGHAHALLERFPHVRVVGIDRDPDALGAAKPHPRLTLLRGNARDLVSLLADNDLPHRVDGILLDLGVSSHQLDVASRGFSYHAAGPLDMRMGPDALRTAGELIDTADVDELIDILRRFGDEPHARRIAAAIIARRPFASTTDLARCVAEAVPAAARRGKHPARRTFQALRIAVNDELAGIDEALTAGITSLVVGGRFVVMAYHSLEDRIVKRTFVEHARTCTCPPGLPECVCGAAPDLRLVSRRGIRPTDGEVARNPRARSATLRVAERITP